MVTSLFLWHAEGEANAGIRDCKNEKGIIGGT